MRANFLHLLGEVEVVFVIWAAIFVLVSLPLTGRHETFAYIDKLDFTEPAFVFVIMAVAATRPILNLARAGIRVFARLIPLHREAAVYLSCLLIGPLLVSFITEPAAMTVTALILKDQFFDRKISARFQYLTLATLFVNVSIGGVLTSYAAPPVLMVASEWHWDTRMMLSLFGWKAVIAVLVNAVIAVALLLSELKALPPQGPRDLHKVPRFLILLHLVALGLIVLNSHHPTIFMGVFLLFLGMATVSRLHQDELKIRESLLVASFLAGLVVMGTPQRWWLDPLIRSLQPLQLFLGTTGLTAITDNAALTYLGSQVQGITAAFQYAIVAGAVAGGGLTVIANAPNPAGYSILQESFGEDGIHPLRLLGHALIPTLVAMACLWLFPGRSF